MFIADAWYMAAWSDELSGPPLARRICDQPVVVFRDASGKAAVLYDSCCHRAAPLSVGTIVDKGLQCGYHGLVFGADGVCTHIPGQDMIPKTARVRSYPVEEKDQMIWVWMGDPEKADTSKILDYPFHNDSARWPHRHGMYEVGGNYLLLIDNLMDLTHLGYVHASNVGGNANTLVEAEMDVEKTDVGVSVKRWMPNCEPPPTYRACVDLPERIDRWQEFSLHAPAGVLQWNGGVSVGQGAREDHSKREGGFSLRLYHFATPVTETSCYYFWSAANGHNVNDPSATDDMVEKLKVALEEDKEIVTAQQTRLNEVGEDWLVNIRSDQARVLMRRYIKNMEESSGPVASGPVVR